MTDIDELRPTEKRRVYDLVRDAGVDVSEWADFAGGLKMAARNPRYCYEWAFLQPGRVAVLNIWLDGIERRRRELVLRDNLRDDAAFYAKSARKHIWERRAQRFDDVVRAAAEDRLPVRVIVCDGRVRQSNRLDAVASKVKARDLDPVPWSVASYARSSGAFTLVRGALPTLLVDQFDVESEDDDDDSPAKKKAVSGFAYARSAMVRAKARLRADGRCELCNRPGFTMSNGGVFLETHHVIPLSGGGKDQVSNVAVLCPNHHREAHHGARRETMRLRLLRKLSKSK